MYCFVNVMSGIYEIITVSFLFCSIASVNYCCLAFYMIYITMNWLSNVCSVGLIIQDGGFTDVYKVGVGSIAFQMTLTIMFIVYYTVAWILCFYAYREFKGMVFDTVGTGGIGMMGMPGMGGAQAP